MPSRVSEFQPSTSKPLLAQSNSVEPRNSRIENFERLRQNTISTQQALSTTSRSTNELELARKQAEIEQKWKARGVLTNGAAYGPDGGTGPEKFVGRHIDLYA